MTLCSPSFVWSDRGHEVDGSGSGSFGSVWLHKNVPWNIKYVCERARQQLPIRCGWVRFVFHFILVWWRWERCQWLTNDERVCSTRRRTNICALFFSFFSFVCSIYYARKTGSLFVARHRRRCRFHLFCLGSMCCHCVRPFCTFLLFYFSRCFCVAGWLILSSIVFYFCSLSWAQSSAPTFSLFPLCYESLILHEEEKTFALHLRRSHRRRHFFLFLPCCCCL